MTHTWTTNGQCVDSCSPAPGSSVRVPDDPRRRAVGVVRRGRHGGGHRNGSARRADRASHRDGQRSRRNARPHIRLSLRHVRSVRGRLPWRVSVGAADPDHGGLCSVLRRLVLRASASARSAAAVSAATTASSISFPFAWTSSFAWDCTSCSPMLTLLVWMLVVSTLVSMGQRLMSTRRAPESPAAETAGRSPR